MPKRKRIGVYGGTFDPVHNGHLQVARAIFEAFQLDRLLFVPAFIPPHKRRQTISTAYHRYAMLALTTADAAEFFVSTLELEAPARPYTIETLGRLQDENPAAQLFFLMGADSFVDVTSWREYERLLSDFDVIVAMRPGQSHLNDPATHLTPRLQERIVDLRGGKKPDSGKDSNLPHIYLTDYVAVDISATSVRQAVSQGQSVEHLVPPAVAAYLAKYRLY